jgi:hypothetical protein
MRLRHDTASLALARSDDRCAGRRMADRLDAMTVGVEHEGGIIVSVVVRPKPRSRRICRVSGFGFSEAPDRRAFKYTFDNLAKVINGFTQAIGLKRYAMHSSGAGSPPPLFE